MNKKIIPKIEIDFDLIYKSGQCFRWENPKLNIFYSPISKDSFIKVNKKKDWFIETNLNNSKIKKYFNLEKSIKEIQKSLDHDYYTKISVDKMKGLRLLQQDPLEMIISFLISQNNTVLNIRKIINQLCKNYGNIINIQSQRENIEVFLFPDINILKNISIFEWENLKTGYRGKYLYSILNSLDDKLLLEFEKLNTDKLRKELSKFHGIGEKVADCIMLYGFDRTEVVPMDRWIKKISINLYKLPDNSSNNYVRKFYEDKFGKWAGWTQLYLFDYVRQNLKRNQNLLELFTPVK